MSEEQTRNLNDTRSFEERVFARFDALDARLTQVESRLTNVEARLEDMDGRLQVLERKAYDTKPIWERALQEIVETRRELVDTRREFTKRLDRIGAVILETRAGLSEAEDRLERLESTPAK
jgi:chromosome segregation ATPase